jgi:hypothetical protein
MRERFQGWYKPTDSELERLWDDGLIIPDANALLAPYRVRTETQRSLFNLLEAHAAQLWCPHQAGLEYQRNRLTVVGQQLAEYDDIRKKVESARNSLLDRRRDHPVLDPEGYEDVVQRALSGILRYIEETQENHPTVLGDDPDSDRVRDRWDELLKDRVGDPFAVDEAWKRQADARYDEETPPGYEDRKKDKGARRYGDLVLWSEILEMVRARKAQSDQDVPILFVTDDAKRDWWRQSEGERLGPDPRLTEELAEAGGSPFWMYSVSRFIEAGFERLGWELGPEGPQELRATAPEPEDSVGLSGIEPSVEDIERE